MHQIVQLHNSCITVLSDSLCCILTFFCLPPLPPNPQNDYSPQRETERCLAPSNARSVALYQLTPLHRSDLLFKVTATDHRPWSTHRVDSSFGFSLRVLLCSVKLNFRFFTSTFHLQLHGQTCIHKPECRQPFCFQPSTQTICGVHANILSSFIK